MKRNNTKLYWTRYRFWLRLLNDGFMASRNAELDVLNQQNI